MSEQKAPELVMVSSAEMAEKEQAAYTRGKRDGRAEIRARFLALLGLRIYGDQTVGSRHDVYMADLPDDPTDDEDD